MKPQASQLTWKTDDGNVLFMEPHYLVRWSLRSSFEWKVKSQISQLTYTKMDLEIFYYRIFFTFSDAPLDILSNEKWYYNNHKENVKMVSFFFQSRNLIILSDDSLYFLLNWMWNYIHHN